MFFNTFNNRYIIKGKIKAQTALHIGGSKDTIIPSSIDNQFIKDAEGKPFIPGSSIKGVCRSFLERLLKTIGYEVCMVPNLCSEKFKTKEQRDEIIKELSKKELTIDKDLILSKHIYENVCIICKLFGSGANGAKLMFKDAKVDKNTFKHFEVRNGVTIDRDKNVAVHGHLYEIEVVPGDTEFYFEMIAENLEKEEEQFVYILLKAMKEGELNLGGLTSRGLGKVTLENITIEKIDKDNLVQVLLKNQQKYIALEELIKDKGGLLNV